jgi:outer membrane protein insertion porin family
MGASLARAQTEMPAAEASLPKKIAAVAIKFIGIANVSEQIVRANVQVRAGADYDSAAIDRDIRSLYRTGLFEFIEVKREELPDKSVNLVFEITPKFRVQAVRFDGNKAEKTPRLQKEVSTKANSTLDEHTVKADVQKLHEFYQKHGYNQVQVSYDIERDRSSGYGTVIFKIREGESVRVADIRFTGNNHVKAKQLRKQMDTKRWWMFSWLTDSGRFKDDAFEDDVSKLADYYRDHGYLDVDVAQDRIIYQ